MNLRRTQNARIPGLHIEFLLGDMMHSDRTRDPAEDLTLTGTFPALFSLFKILEDSAYEAFCIYTT